MSDESNDGIVISRQAVRRARAAVGAVIACAVLLALAILLSRQFATSDADASAINSNEYQAVFLTNQQIYFGRLSAPDATTLYLRHVYYLSSQSGTGGRGVKFQLLKLTSDLQGPEDLLVIHRSQVLYWENLKPGGRAAQLLGAQP